MKDGWKIARIGEICNVKTGKLDANAACENGKYPFFTCSKETLRINTYSYDLECLLIAGNGDLNVKYYKGKFDAYQRTYIVSLKNNTLEISTYYLYMFFSKYIEVLRNRSIGGVIKYIKLGDITNAKVLIPSYEEQSRIVEELDLLSNIIEKKRQQLSELDNLAQSIFYDMFGDPVTNEKGWEVKKLSEISNIISGFAFNSSDFSSKNTIKAIKITNVGVNEFIEDDISLPSKYNDKHNYMVKAGDVVIALTRTVISTGVKRAIVPVNYDGALVNQRVAAIVVDENVIYKSFLYNYLGTDFVKEYVLKHASALMQPNLSINDLKKTPIYYPPLHLQQLFAQKIEAIEKEKELIKQSIKETEELFNSRMDYYFG